MYEFQKRLSYKIKKNKMKEWTESEYLRVAQQMTESEDPFTQKLGEAIMVGTRVQRRKISQHFAKIFSINYDKTLK